MAKTHEHVDQQVRIDDGIRRWYESCRCCFGDAYPDLKKQLDDERRAARGAPAGPGICEVAEGGPSSAPGADEA